MSLIGAQNGGDGVLLEFPSVVDAFECAVAVQAVMDQRNEGVPQDRADTLMPLLASAFASYSVAHPRYRFGHDDC
jgi:hypothetical protein